MGNPSTPGNGKSKLPPDDLTRTYTLARPETDPNLKHVAVVGDAYTILMSGKDTNGQYCLIDMRIPPCGGPTLHRHNFEEMFSLLEGELEFHFRGEKVIVRAGETVNIPANAPHFFRNEANKPVHLLCMATPAGLDEFFLDVGLPLADRNAAPPELTEEQKKEFGEKSRESAPKHRIELL